MAAHSHRRRIKCKSPSRSKRTMESPTNYFPAERRHYSSQDDSVILKFVRRNAHGPLTVAGNVLWKEAENEKLTDHPWQSMRDHYLKYLKPGNSGHQKSVYSQEVNATTSRNGNSLDRTYKLGAQDTAEIFDMSGDGYRVDFNNSFQSSFDDNNSSGDGSSSVDEFDRDLFKIAQGQNSQSRAQGTTGKSLGIKCKRASERVDEPISEVESSTDEESFLYKLKLRKRKCSSSCEENVKSKTKSTRVKPVFADDKAIKTNMAKSL